MYIKCYAIVSMKLINTPKRTILHHFFKGGRHLHEIFNESIIFMSHFSIGMIDIHKKISLKFFFFKFKMAAVAGVQKQKKFSGVHYSKNVFAIIYNFACSIFIGVTLCSEPTIS